MSPHDLMCRIDDLLSHVWMVRTFLKHAEESEDDEQLQEVFRDLYDYMLALGPAWNARDADAYLKMARKKLGKLRAAAERFRELQPEVSLHTNFQMAARSLTTAVNDVAELLDRV